MELILPTNLVGADSPDRGSEMLELGAKITEMAALLGSTRRPGFDVEEQDEGPLGQEMAEGNGLSRMVYRLEIIDHFSNATHPGLPVQSSSTQAS